MASREEHQISPTPGSGVKIYFSRERGGGEAPRAETLVLDARRRLGGATCRRRLDVRDDHLALLILTPCQSESAFASTFCDSHCEYVRQRKSSARTDLGLRFQVSPSGGRGPEVVKRGATSVSPRPSVSTHPHDPPEFPLLNNAVSRTRELTEQGRQSFLRLAAELLDSGLQLGRRRFLLLHNRLVLTRQLLRPEAETTTSTIGTEKKQALRFVTEDHCDDVLKHRKGKTLRSNKLTGTQETKASHLIVRRLLSHAQLQQCICHKTCARGWRLLLPPSSQCHPFVTITCAWKQHVIAICHDACV